MSTAKNAEKVQQYESRFSLIVELIPAFASGANLVREVKNLSTNIKRIA